MALDLSMKKLRRSEGSPLNNTLAEQPRPASPSVNSYEITLSKSFSGNPEVVPSACTTDDSIDERSENKKPSLFTDVEQIPDNRPVMCRIFVPKRHPALRGRWFHVKMPAFVLKRKVLDQFISSDLIKRLLKATDKEGNEIMQKFVDDVLKLKRIYNADLQLVEWG
ncbi:hypothetical protein KR018_003920 [Drosophila ironensis]|nr:hypothetical protein KR018_003920 [Drosophila ironensis]